MIEVHHLSKVFRIPHAKKKTLFHNLLSLASRRYDYERFYALQDLEFEVHRGEFVGIIGRNGSGKSTLLKIIAHIFQPTSGRVIIRDEVFPLLELGVGFQPDFSVRDNIYLCGSLFGFNRREMGQKVDSILAFSELERFADARFEKLSTGMQMRLGFAIAIQSVAPIMLVDEILAVGDRVFAEKCREVLWKFKSDGITMLFVSHDMTAIQEYCDRVIVLDNGKIIAQGEPGPMIERYNATVCP